MKKSIYDFLNEINDNFSEIYVETFIVKYYANYGIKNMGKYLKKSKKILFKKINQYIKKKGY